MGNNAMLAHETKVHRAAREVIAGIAGLPASATDEEVLKVMQDQSCSGRVLCDAFWLMDNEPGQFNNRTSWHPRLRSLRNNTILGQRMFALFA